MTEQKRADMINVVRDCINYIAQKEYTKLNDITTIERSWCGDGTQAEGMKEFGKWLDEQLNIWAEDEGKDFTVDMFDENNIKISEREDDDNIFVMYDPKSYGEQLDFWFEFCFSENGNGELISEFNVNM